MNILFTICGRAGSKGFKNKNLKEFAGIPLVYYSIAGIRLYMDRFCGQNDRVDVVLNTDSRELMDIVKEQTLQSIDNIERSEELSGDTVPKVAVIKDSLQKMEQRNGIKYEMVVDLDITSPLRTVWDVKNAIDRKKEREDTIVVYSVTDSRRNPYFNMVRQEGNYFTKAIASDYTARQQATVFYDMNASIYAYSAKALEECENLPGFFNGKCDAVIMKDTGILDIDSEEDYELMQVVGEHMFKKYLEYGEIRKMAEQF